MYNPHEESKVCAALRFPLMCGIIIIHAQFSQMDIDGSYLSNHSISYNPIIYYEVSRLISQIICAICVPLFYFISGYLFFYSSQFDFNVYKNKMKRRLHSLLIPYLLWNFVILLFYLMAQHIFPTFISSRNIPISSYRITDYLWAFWDVSKVNHSGNAFPIAAQFWFIRNLMVVAFVSPIIYIAIKYLKLIFIYGLGICWFFNLWPHLPGVGSEAFFFFSFGAFFSIFQKNFTSYFSKSISCFPFIYLIVIIACLLFWETQYKIYILKFSILLGIPIAIGLTAKNKKTINFFNSHKNFPECSFFMFAYHFLPLVLLYRYLLKLISDHSDIICLLIYFLAPTVIIVIGYYLYLYLNRFLPRFTSIITGGR